MIPVRDNLVSKETPVLTWTLVGLNALVYLWDRGGALGGSGLIFSDLAFRPSEVLLAFSPQGDRMAWAKIFTSMFLHGGIAHILGNMLFLLAFGPSVERALGGFRFALYYIFWGVMAAMAHIFVNPGSSVPTLGASGAIGGVLGAYFLLFPTSRIKVIIPPLFFLPFNVASWILLGLWFIWQIVLPQDGVANWAHAGGFLAGMVTILVMGGRTAALKGVVFEEDQHFDDD